MIKELCVSGGATRGIIYVGALYGLEKNKLLFKDKLEKCVGVSIGSFILGCYLLGYSVSELFELSLELDLKSLNDISVKKELSILEGNVFKEWVFKCINQKENASKFTLIDLYNKSKVHFIIVQSCIEDGLVHMDHINSPNVLLYDALIASMSIPFIFPPHEINGKRYVDGGLLDNFPMYILSEHAYGICNGNLNKNKDNDINNTFSYIIKLKDMVYNHIDQFKKVKSKNIIKIDTSDFLFLDFNLSIDDKITLFKRGQETIEEFISTNKSIINDSTEPSGSSRDNTKDNTESKEDNNDIIQKDLD